MHREGKYKGEGGFRFGYLAYLKQMMMEKLLEYGLKTSNIDSRLSY